MSHARALHMLMHTRPGTDAAVELARLARNTQHDRNYRPPTSQPHAVPARTPTKMINTPTRKTHVSDAERTQIIAIYRQTNNISECIRQTKRNRATIHRILNDAGLHSPRRYVDHKRVIDLLSQGCIDADVARQVGCHRSTVKAIRAKARKEGQLQC